VAKTPIGQDFDKLLDDHYKKSHLKLLSRWADFSHRQIILITDLFAEARCPSHSFTLELMKSNSGIIGIYISGEICQEAKRNSTSLSIRINNSPIA
jgi:hypothetical protein